MWALLLRRLLNPGLYLGAALSLLLIIAAYQVRPSYDVPIGTRTDGPLLRDFNTAETMQGANPVTFRWSTADSHIVLTGVGAQDFDVTLTLAGSRPPGQSPPNLQIDVDGREMFNGTASPDLIPYSFFVPRELLRDGTLDIRLQSGVYTPEGDPNPRSLGVVVTSLTVRPGSAPDPFIAPPAAVLASLVGAFCLIGVVLSLLGWGAGGVLAGMLVPAGFAGWLLVFDRLWLTSMDWFATWPQSLAAAAVFATLAYLLARALFGWCGLRWPSTWGRVLITVVFVAYAVRLAGQLHPQIFIVDLGFHEHRLDTVRSGTLLFTIQSAEWAGHSTYYLPSAYIFMLPLRWLIDNSQLVVRLFTVGVGTMGAVLVFLAGAVGLRSYRGAFIAAALYLTMPLSVLPFSWGITTNLFGEFFALFALTALVVTGSGDGALSLRRPAFWLLAASLSVAILSHPGVAQLTALAVALVCILWLVRGRQVGGVRRAGWGFVALAVSGLFAYVIYYRNVLPDMLNTLAVIRQERAAESQAAGLNLKVGGSVSDRSLGLVVRYVNNWGDWLAGGLAGFWNEARAYYKAWPFVGAGLGYVALLPGWGTGRANSRQRSRLVLVAAGWTLAILLFAFVGWLLNLYVRYALFALPVVALGVGTLLGRVWRDSRASRLLVTLLVVFFAVEALALWHYRINYGLK